jgi:hypothetical protein
LPDGWVFLAGVALATEAAGVSSGVRSFGDLICKRRRKKKKNIKEKVLAKRKKKKLIFAVDSEHRCALFSTENLKNRRSSPKMRE